MVIDHFVFDVAGPAQSGGVFGKSKHVELESYKVLKVCKEFRKVFTYKLDNLQLDELISLCRMLGSGPLG